MSEAPDPLEAELSALRPHGASARLRQGIAQSLIDTPCRTRRRLAWFAVAAGLAAACLVVGLLWWGAGRQGRPEPIVHRPRPAPSAPAEHSEPTVLDYERALARSPDDLDALFNERTHVASESNPELVRLGAFSRSHTVLKALLGDD
jgi:hypothetical protein